MNSLRDIKILIFVGYLIAYPLAVVPPILLDPILRSHFAFGPRSYPYAFLCIPIYLMLVGGQAIILYKVTNFKLLYFSICLFLGFVFLSLPIFRPEFPHANVLSVGLSSAAFLAISVFIWSLPGFVLAAGTPRRAEGPASLAYLKDVLSFFRQVALAAVALFGALLFAAYGFYVKFNELTVSDKSELFLLNLNGGIHIGFYALLSLAGPIRYLLMTNIYILLRMRHLAAQLDAANTTRKRARDQSESRERRT